MKTAKQQMVAKPAFTERQLRQVRDDVAKMARGDLVLFVYILRDCYARDTWAALRAAVSARLQVLRQERKETGGDVCRD